MNKQVAYYPDKNARAWLADKRTTPALNALIAAQQVRESSEATLLDILAEIAASLAAIRGLLEASAGF